MVFPVLVTASLINTLISVSRTIVRLPWVLHRGVSLAGDCIFNKNIYLCSGLWYDYFGSYTVEFPLLVTASLISTTVSVQDCGTTTLGPTP